MIACKCMNFIGSLPQLHNLGLQAAESVNSNINNNNNSNGIAGDASQIGRLISIEASIQKAFEQTAPRDFIHYGAFMDFFSNAIGPVPDLREHISQVGLIYGLPLVSNNWMIYFCINCKTVICAKRMISAPVYFVNSELLCIEEQLKQRRSDKSYSEIFDVVIIDHGDTGSSAGVAHSASNLSIGSLSTHAPGDGRQQRLRQMQTDLQARLQAEIKKTNESIERYTEQQFALLKSFSEKCEQEGAQLMCLIQHLPEQVNELLDGGRPLVLEVIGAGNGLNAGAWPGARRRNTISSRRDLDALDLDSSMPIPMRTGAGRPTPAQLMNFAKSLPIEIANSPLAHAHSPAQRANNNNFVLDGEEVPDNTVDIAASIKALAKSVHGEAVFGDLPRPRLRSQI
ncbi:L [Drosophila busckii]|uniref:L n=1 Tax=Drosophila busckii TaxID=30019 RepID=A0A0M4EIR8_DROBS|nr:L [Drosophila busckii] [Drosophila busckii]